jgi:predicted dehydrogenase
MKIKKICFVGYSPHVEKTIIPSISLDKKNIKIISSKSSIKNFDTFPDIKSALKIISKDYVIYNATPPKLHFVTSKLILNMGFNLIVEKPICLNIYQLNKLKILAEKRRLFIFENMMYFYSNQFSLFKKYINKKNKIKHIELNFSIPSFRKDSFRSNSDIDSSLLYDVACYPFSLISYLGYVIRNFNISYKFKNGIFNYLNINFVSKNIKFYVKVSFFKKYENYAKIYFTDDSSIQFDHFFYGKKIIKNNIKIISKFKRKNFLINDCNVFSKIFSFNKKKIYLLSKKHLYIANNYLKTLARIKRIIKQ